MSFLNLDLDTFFEEWEDDPRLLYFTGAGLFFLGVTLLAIFNVFPEYETAALVYMIMLIVVGFVLLFEVYIKDSHPLTPMSYWGNIPVLSLILGLFVGIVLFLNNLTLVTLPLAINSVVSSIDFFVLFFVVFTAPIVEEFFFRGLIQQLARFSLENLFGFSNFVAGIVATFFQAGVFAFFHFRVLGGSIDAIIPSFVFALIVTFGNYLFRSLGFGMGLHLLNNAKAVGLL